MIPFRIGVALVAVASSLFCVDPAAAESWVLWKKADVTEMFGRAKDKTTVTSVSVFETKTACLTKAKDYALGESGKPFNADGGVHEMGNGQGFAFTFVGPMAPGPGRVEMISFQCWPVGVTPQ
jgi:hypothetical protein